MFVFETNCHVKVIPLAKSTQSALLLLNKKMSLTLVHRTPKPTLLTSLKSFIMKICRNLIV